MTVCPNQAARPAGNENFQEHISRLQVAAPYFDAEMDGWVLSRYADVTAALHSPELVPVGPASKEKQPVVDEPARLRMRAETRAVLSRAALRAWRKQMLCLARERVAHFDCEHPVDLIKDYAEPICLALAILIAQPDPASSEHLAALAAQVSLAAADPFHKQHRAQSKAATAELRPFFTRGPEPMRDSCFVALSRTLVALLGNAWFALAEHPQQWERLHTQPALVTRGVDELQRFAGLTRVLFHQAIADTTLNGFSIRKGDRVILCLLAAYRDPELYPDPHELSVMRTRIRHVSLGAGRHACVGAPLVRLATVAATLALVERFSGVRLTGQVAWEGGIGFVSPVALPVLLVERVARQ